MKKVAIARFGPSPSEDFLTYPGAIPTGPFIYDGSVWLLDSSAPLAELSEALRAARSLPLADRLAVICSGSNASPPQVHRKASGFGDDPLVPFIPARFPGLNAMYAGHVSQYGALPATLDKSDESNEFFVAFYTPNQLRQVHGTEHGNYNFAELIDTELQLSWLGPKPRVYAFLSTKGVLALDGYRKPLRSCDQRMLLTLLFERLSAAPDLPSLEAYLDNPKRHREALDTAIGALGLRRPHTIPNTVHDPNVLLAGRGE